MELLQFCAAASNFVSANINSLTCIQNLASKRISRLLKVFKVYEAADEYVDMFVVSCEDKNPQTETRKQKRTRGHLPSLGRCN